LKPAPAATGHLPAYGIQKMNITIRGDEKFSKKHLLPMSMVCSICMLSVLGLGGCWGYYHYRFNPKEYTIHDWQMHLFAGFFAPEEGSTKPSSDPETRMRQWWRLSIDFTRLSNNSSTQLPHVEGVVILYVESGERITFPHLVRESHRPTHLYDYTYTIDSLALPDTSVTGFDLSFQLQLIDSVTQNVVLDTSLIMSAKLDKHTEIWLGE